jgi:antitoxin CptB
MDELDVRRRRAAYRAAHRGTKEMDWLLGRYAEARLAAMTECQLTEFEQLLAIADPDLQGWLIEPAAQSDRAFAALVADIRAFHGLGAKA